MPNRNYERGRRFEYAIQQELTKDGFVVYRTAGSHGIADCIAVRSDVVLFIQAKVTQDFIKDEVSARSKYKTELQKLHEHRVPACARKSFWIKHKKGVIKLDVL